MPADRPAHQAYDIQPLAAVAGYLMPGLGHILIGEKKRGFIIMIALTCLFFTGLLIGGIDVIDYRNQKLWFAGQCLFSPIAPAVGYIHELRDRQMDEQAAEYRRQHPEQFRGIREDRTTAVALQHILPQDAQSLPYIKSTARVNEIGTLYCAMAGLLNLLVIIDAVARPRPGTDGPGRGKLVTREDAP